jgi:hypothetical protein
VKTRIGIGQPLVSHKQEGIAEGEQDVKISDYRVCNDNCGGRKTNICLKKLRELSSIIIPRNILIFFHQA